MRVETHRDQLLENMREAAHSIYEEYLSEKANPRLKVDDSVVKRLLFKIRTEPPHWDWFAEVQEAVFDKLQADERFLESFKRSMGYVKLLAELELLKDPTAAGSGRGGAGGAGDGHPDDEGDSQSLTGDELSIYDSLSLNSYEDELREYVGGGGSNRGSESNVATTSEGSAEYDPDATLVPQQQQQKSLTLDSGLGGSSSSSVKSHRRMGSDSLFRPARLGHSRNASQGSLNAFVDLPPILSAEVQDFQILKEPKGGKSYAAYVILVRSRDAR